MAISAAPTIGFTADIKKVDGVPRTNRGRIPGVTGSPHLERMLWRGGADGGYPAQVCARPHLDLPPQYVTHALSQLW